MNSCRRSLLLAAVMAGTVLSAHPSEPGLSGSLSNPAWKAVAKDGDTVSLSMDAGILSVRYQVNVNQHRLVGHKSNTEASFDLLLEKPVDLSPEDARIVFDARLAGGRDQIAEIRPLIEDERGERLSYVPQKVVPLVPDPAGKGWQSWRSQAFFATEAGGASFGIYESEDSRGNAWPDGRLRFLGFQVRVNLDRSKKQSGVTQGEIAIAHVAAGALRLQEEPFVFADTIFDAKGKWRISYEVRPDFQGKPNFEESRVVEFDPGSEASRHQRLTFQAGPYQNSWLRYRVTGEDGAIVRDGEVRYEQDADPGQVRKLPALDPEKAPELGRIRINPGASDGEPAGILKAGEPPLITFRIFPEDNSRLRLKWELRQYAFPVAVGSGASEVTGGGKPYRDIEIRLPIEEGRDAYRLSYSLVDEGDRVVDRGELILGVARDGIAPRTSRSGQLPHRDEIKKRAYFRTTPFPADQSFPTEEDALRAYSELLDESRQISTNITFMVELADFQILPGIFDFALLDRFMDLAADKGLTVTIRLGHMERLSPYLWQPYTLPRNFDGAALRGHPSYGSYDMTDPKYVESWKQGFRALYDRYHKHPAFEGYYVMQAGGEWAIPDEPWNGFISGYSWSAARAFRAYLRDSLKLDLAALNQRWGTSYRDWNEVFPPQPELESGTAPDLRPQWIDFCRAKQAWKDEWFPEIASSIRGFDNERVVIAYSDGSRGVEKLYGLVDYLHNGGNDHLEGEGSLVDAWEKGRIGWITEPHHPHYWAAANDPGGRGWILDWSLYVMTAQAGAGGQNLHVYYVPYKKSASLAAHYGFIAAHDRYEHFKPILSELHGIRLLEPARKVAVLQSDDTLQTKHRTTFTSRLPDLRRWFELVRSDSIDYEFYRPDHEQNYRMVVLNPLDEVMDEKSISAIRRMAENGAWIVTSARTGFYSSEGGPDQKFALLRSLGISGPSGRYETASSGVVAKLKPGQKLLPGRSGVPFVSQRDIAEDMRRPEVAEKFWSWPYRWIPQADYFGHYAENTGVGGDVLATFPDGGAALTMHRVGKGFVLVFWGTPSCKQEEMAGVMASIARAAGVVDERGPRPIPLMLQARRDDLDRQYAVIYNEKPGVYLQPVSTLPDGEWFVDDMVTGRRYGLIDGSHVRKEGISLKFEDGESPLKVLRFIRRTNMGDTEWTEKFGRADGSSATSD